MEAKTVNAKDREIFLQNNLSKVSDNVLNTFSKFCGKTQFPQSFGRIAETMRKLCLSAKFPH